MVGLDTKFVNGIEDDRLVRIALDEGRILLTKDTQILKRRLVTSGQLKALLIGPDEVKEQLRQVVSTFKLQDSLNPFSLCLECNQPLEPREKEEIRERVPPYVFKTQERFVECSACHRIYWRGTHWQRMSQELERVVAQG